LNGQLDRELDLSIEGFHVSADEAVAIVTGQEPPMLDDESRQAVACYARAIDHVGVMARDPGFRWYDRVILDLHFDACFFQRDKSPVDGAADRSASAAGAVASSIKHPTPMIFPD
jgi:hypothetical protein